MDSITCRRGGHTLFRPRAAGRARLRRRGLDLRNPGHPTSPRKCAAIGHAADDAVFVTERLGQAAPRRVYPYEAPCAFDKHLIAA